MTTLAFLAALAVIFATIIALESRDPIRLHRPAGLIEWLAGGNWPAKIGGALIVVGIGALLRYALLNVELPAQLKLGAGVATALALGFASTFVPEGPAKKPVALALTGSAFGVAYLTAYSAFGLFQYLSNPAGLAVLGVVSVAAGVHAITRGAQSLAILSMVGAFLAPAFAVGDPGPGVVYGYYAGASLLTLVMVALRGWRPLIHLSFLFTLGGGWVFAWTAKYYGAAHADTMQLMLLLLAAIHVAMPICESGSRGGRTLQHLDVAYMLALPVVSALLALVLAPNRVHLSTELFALGAIWAVATAALAALSRKGAAAHAVIAVALGLLGVAARFRDLPWELIGLVLAVGALWAAAKLRPVDRLHGVLAGVAILFGALHILGSLAGASSRTSFDSGAFAERLVVAALLIGAGAICRRIRQPLDTLLLAAGILWGFVAVGFELVRWELATVSLVAHGFLLLVAGSLWIPGRKVRLADSNAVLLVVLILATAVWASVQASSVLVSWISLVAASLALVGMALRPLSDDEKDVAGERLAAILAAPIVAAVWGSRIAVTSGVAHAQLFAATCGAAIALAALASGLLTRDERSAWLEQATSMFAGGFGALLGVSTLLFIVRDSFAVALEVLCVFGLVMATAIHRRLSKSVEVGVAVCMAGVGLVIQANLMRLLGPDGDMSIADVLALKWRAVISLLWVIVGCALTIWSRRAQSRVLWLSGAALLVGAAVKLMLLDFGSLGQLANILAVIAAGGVFLLVGWLAPMPPGSTRAPDTSTETQASDEPEGDQKGSSRWTLAALLVAGAVLAFNSATLFELYDAFGEDRAETRVEPVREKAVQVASQDDGMPAPARMEVPAGVEPPARVTEPAEVAPAIEQPSATAVAEYSDNRAGRTSAEATEIAPAAASEADERPAWQPPPTVDKNGVPTYTDYSYPRAERSPETAPQSGDRPPTPAAKEEGLDQLMREGRLRRATLRDIKAWQAATGSQRGINLRRPFGIDLPGAYGENEPLARHYVVLREMTYPEGLTGAHAVTFILPRGVPRPYGTPGHSEVLEMPP